MMKNSLALRTAEELILEGIVTTTNDDGTANVSPMGPVVDRSMNVIRLRPFKTSRTYQNLKDRPKGIFHVTDDAHQLALATLGKSAELPIKRIDRLGYIVSGTCRWYAFAVTDMDESQDRIEIVCHVSHVSDVRPFLGWNRAAHSVVEAAILASRVHILSRDDIETQLDALAQIVLKTASDRERRAFEMIMEYVRSQ